MTAGWIVALVLGAELISSIACIAAFMLSSRAETEVNYPKPIDDKDTIVMERQ